MQLTNYQQEEIKAYQKKKLQMITNVWMSTMGCSLRNSKSDF